MLKKTLKSKKMANETSSIENIHEYCTKENCIVNDKEKANGILVCRKCTRKVHHVCSELPPYQIQLCLTSKSRSDNKMSNNLRKQRI